MSADARTRAFYDREAADYAGRARGPQRRFEAFMERLPPGACVLDLGCGAGQDSAALKARGFRVVSTDASAGLAAEAKRLWNIDVRVAAFADLDDADAFDGVWANASLHHAAASDLPDILARAHRALRPDGLIAASLKEGVDRRDRFDRFYCAMDEAALARLFADRTRWAEATIDRGAGGGHDGEPTMWLHVLARRAP